MVERFRRLPFNVTNRAEDTVGYLPLSLMYVARRRTMGSLSGRSSVVFVKLVKLVMDKRTSFHSWCFQTPDRHFLISFANIIDSVAEDDNSSRICPRPAIMFIESFLWPNLLQAVFNFPNEPNLKIGSLRNGKAITLNSRYLLQSGLRKNDLASQSECSFRMNSIASCAV